MKLGCDRFIRAAAAMAVVALCACSSESPSASEGVGTSDDAVSEASESFAPARCKVVGRGAKGFSVMTSEIAHFAAKAVGGIAGLPADPNKKISRADIQGYWENSPWGGPDAARIRFRNVRLGLDLGGEGRFTYDGQESGDCMAINVNAQSTNSQDSSLEIPSLVRVADFAHGYPFADGFASFIMMQGAPLTDVNISEIRRILKSGGVARLDLVEWGNYRAQVDKLRRAMNCVRGGYREYPNGPYVRFECTKNSDSDL